MSVSDLANLVEGRYYYIPYNVNLIAELYNFSYNDKIELFEIKISELEEIPPKILENCNFELLDRKCQDLLANSSIRSTEIDQEIGKSLKNSIDVNRSEASRSEFWNGIIFGRPKLLDLACVRWNIKNPRDYFLGYENLTQKQGSGKRFRFFASQSYTALRKHTYSRIWWAWQVANNDETYARLFTASQDAIDRILERDFINNEISKIFFEAWKEYEDKKRHILATAWQYIVRFGLHLVNGTNPNLKNDLKATFFEIFEFSNNKTRRIQKERREKNEINRE